MGGAETVSPPAPRTLTVTLQLPGCACPCLPVTHSDVQMPSGRQGPPDRSLGSHP